MSWLDPALSIAWRFITWRLRINRLQFFLTYVGAAAVGGAIAVSAMFAVSALLQASPEERPQIPALCFGIVGFVFWFGLLAGRSHDLGFSGVPACILFCIPWLPFSVIMDRVLSLFGGAINALDKDGRLYAAALPAMPIVLLLLWAMIIACVFWPGQRKENRFGPPSVRA